jgi:hypothetical protein
VNYSAQVTTPPSILAATARSLLLT